MNIMMNNAASDDRGSGHHDQPQSSELTSNHKVKVCSIAYYGADVAGPGPIQHLKKTHDHALWKIGIKS